MNGTRLKTGLRTLVAALALAGAFATRAQANPISQGVYFSTSGTIGDGSGPIKFDGSTGSFLAPGTFDLGHFHTAKLPTGASLTYNDTPFTITGTAGPSMGSTTGGFLINGFLNGTLTDTTGSTMFATVSSVSPTFGNLPFTIGSLGTSLESNSVAIAPNGVNSGNSTVSAQVMAAPVPEPATITLFVSALGGLALRRRLRLRAAAVV